MRTFAAVCRRLDNHWFGDLIALACLFGLIPLVLILGAALGGVQ